MILSDLQGLFQQIKTF